MKRRVSLSDETLIDDAVAALVKPDPARVRQAVRSEDGFDRVLWRDLGAQGWLSIAVPEALGGSELGVLPLSVIARRIGSSAAPVPFCAAGVFAMYCAARCEDPEAQSDLLSRLVSGEQVATVAWQREDGSLDCNDCGVVAAVTDEGVRLKGKCRFVQVPTADVLIVLCKEPAGPALYRVSRNQPGVAVARERTADGGTAGLIEFHDAIVPPAARLIAAGRALQVFERALDVTLVACAAELLGIVDRVLDMTLEYLRTRVQFNAPIGSLQVIQHRAVDLWIQRELTDAAVKAAAVRLDEAQATAVSQSIAASGAKARASQAALTVCNQALQLHGAIGFTDEYGLGLYMNRAITLAAWLGNARHHLRRFFRLSESERSAGRSHAA